MLNGYMNAVTLLCPMLQACAMAIPKQEQECAEEFRLRTGRKPTVLLPNGEKPLCEQNITNADLLAVMEKATKSSVHSYTQQLKNGFLSAEGGVRVGVCGTAVMDGGISHIREISSLSIRIPRQIKEIGKEIIPEILDRNVLVISPPGGGKTTFLRELVRTASEQGFRVSLCDERGEIAASYLGSPQFDVGRCTDVLTGAPKTEAAAMLLRAMNPQIIAMDEVSTPEDANVIRQILGCGVGIYATAHAKNLEDLKEKAIYREILSLHAFDVAICIKGTGKRKYCVEQL